MSMLPSPLTPMQLIDALAGALAGDALAKVIEDWQEARRVAWGKYLELRRDLNYTPVEPETEAIRIRLVNESHAILREWGFTPPQAVLNEQTREPEAQHRRRMLNQLLAAWDANPDVSLGGLLADVVDAYDAARPTYDRQWDRAQIGDMTDADLLKGLLALAPQTKE